MRGKYTRVCARGLVGLVRASRTSRSDVKRRPRARFADVVIWDKCVVSIDRHSDVVRHVPPLLQHRRREGYDGGILAHRMRDPHGKAIIS